MERLLWSTAGGLGKNFVKFLKSLFRDTLQERIPVGEMPIRCGLTDAGESSEGA